jgi:hypothetical protein
MPSSYDLNFDPLHGHHHYGLVLVLTMSRSMVNIMVILVIIWSPFFIIQYWASIHGLFTMVLAMDITLVVITP